MPIPGIKQHVAASKPPPPTHKTFDAIAEYSGSIPAFSKAFLVLSSSSLNQLFFRLLCKKIIFLYF
ncbi:hypothetical protein PA0343 [Candidatus Phytoplasma australiense]|uniref:Uncharacterized protein n=1 Tax=Phytoplasma australiense TaxID=59748 RepID=B1V9Q6_PHYAS|nr:hypothetical protein PA0343 [Candidatus Phytoplasma australiense]